MNGKVFIENLSLQCLMGVTPQERKKRQEIVASVFLDIDPEKAIASDNVRDTANYSAIRSQILELVKISKFNLLESLASEIADICLRDPHVKNVKVKAKKPSLYHDTKSVGVVIEKER